MLILTTYIDLVCERKFCFQERKLFGQPKRAKVYDGWARGARAHRNVDQKKFYWVSFYFGDCLILMPSLTKLPTYFELSDSVFMDAEKQPPNFKICKYWAKYDRLYTKYACL